MTSIDLSSTVGFSALCSSPTSLPLPLPLTNTSPVFDQMAFHSWLSDSINETDSLIAGHWDDHDEHQTQGSTTSDSSSKSSITSSSPPPAALFPSLSGDEDGILSLSASPFPAAVDKSRRKDVNAYQLLSSSSFSSSSSSSSSFFSSSSSSSSSSSFASSRPRFYSRKIACQVCHFSKVRCDGGRPCTRCVRLHHTEHCIDRPSKRQTPRTSNTSSNGNGNSQHTNNILIKRRFTHPRESSASLSPSASHKRFAYPASHSQSSDADFPISLHLSLPACLGVPVFPPVNEELLSATLLSSHFHLMSRLHASGFSPPAKVQLRDKLVMHAWFHEMLTTKHIEELAHFFTRVYANRWYDVLMDSRHVRLLAAVSELLSDDTHASPLSSSNGDHVCNGQVCSGYCPYVRRLTLSAPCVLSWLSSPTTPIPDQADFPNHAFLCIKHHIQDQRLTHLQTQLVYQHAIRVARELLASHATLDYDYGRGSPLLDSPASPQLHPDFDDSLVASSSVSSIELCLSVQVNCAFERLFSYTQEEIRYGFIKYGEKALYALFRCHDWSVLLDLDREVRVLQRKEFRICVVCKTREQTEVPCILQCLTQFDEEGKPSVRYLSFIPLPTATSGARR